MGSPKIWGRDDNGVAYEHECCCVSLFDVRVTSEEEHTGRVNRLPGERCEWNGQSEMVRATYAAVQPSRYQIDGLILERRHLALVISHQPSAIRPE